MYVGWGCVGCQWLSRSVEEKKRKERMISERKRKKGFEEKKKKRGRKGRLLLYSRAVSLLRGTDERVTVTSWIRILVYLERTRTKTGSGWWDGWLYT